MQVITNYWRSGTADTFSLKDRCHRFRFELMPCKSAVYFNYSILKLNFNCTSEVQCKSTKRTSEVKLQVYYKYTTPLDPSNFFWALHRKLSTNNQIPFQSNTQQDVPEIPQVVFDELKGHSTIASNILATSVRTSTTCDTCGCCNIDEVKLDIIPLPLAKSISLSLDRYLSSENLTGVNKWFCPACNGFMDSTRETRIVDSGSILVLQLLRYNNFKRAVIKNNTRVNCCSETLRLKGL